MPQVEVDGLDDQLRRAGRGRAAPADPVHCPRTTRATRSSSRPTRSTSAASRSTFPAPARATRRPARTRPRATPTSLPPSSAPSGSSGPRGGYVARRRRRPSPGRAPSRPDPLAVVAQRLARERCLPEDGLEQWRTLAPVLPTVADVVIQGIFPWCFTPEMYVERPEFVDTLVDFVRGRPAQPVDAFWPRSDAVIAHDASTALSEIDVPT